MIIFTQYPPIPDGYTLEWARLKNCIIPIAVTKGKDWHLFQFVKLGQWSSNAGYFDYFNDHENQRSFSSLKEAIDDAIDFHTKRYTDALAKVHKEQAVADKIAEEIEIYSQALEKVHVIR